MKKNKAARSSCSYSRANVLSVLDVQSIARDVLTAVAGVALIVGIPFIMAVFKSWGWW